MPAVKRTAQQRSKAQTDQLQRVTTVHLHLAPIIIGETQRPHWQRLHANHSLASVVVVAATDLGSGAEQRQGIGERAHYLHQMGAQSPHFLQR